jgi:Amt family ammonium transporter
MTLEYILNKKERYMEIQAGDTAWILVATALVMLMTTPGLALFYGGMVRRKNVLGVLMQCFISLALVSVLWIIFGYSFAFGQGDGLIGNRGWMMLEGVGQAPNPDYAATIPHIAFALFESMFAVITPALIIGAFAERMKFSAFILFTIFWMTFIYCPMAHMVWSLDGVLHQLGTLDFAGGTVVHLSAGVAGLVTALFIGKRVGIYDKPGMHNVPFVAIGASLLWFGWFGFNAGSALGANGLAAQAFITTNTAASAATLSWALLEWFFSGKPTIVGACSGAIAGLVAITPAAGYVDVSGALWIGFLVSIFCYFMVVKIKPRVGYDDTLDAFAVHGIGGLWGAIATGIFCVQTVNAAGADGVLMGNFAQLKHQAIACLVTIVYTAFMTWIVCFVVNKLVGIRATQEDEVIGLDLTQHHERAYTLLD